MLAQVSSAEFADNTLGLDLETSYLGVVLFSSWWNTNLKQPIPVGSRYARQAITAIDAISRVGPELIIGARQTGKSAVAIGGSNTEAFICIYTVSRQEALAIIRIINTFDSCNDLVSQGSGYAGRYINASGAPVGRTGQVEISVFSLSRISSRLYWYNSIRCDNSYNLNGSRADYWFSTDRQVNDSN